MNIFNIKWKDKKVIIININPTLKPNKIVNEGNFSICFHNEEIIGINIFESSLTNKYELGILYPTVELLSEIANITNTTILHNKIIESNIVVGKILTAEPIPNTHLKKCIVDINNDKLEIVCGAANARDNLITVAALNNAIIPTGKLIQNGKLLGHTSNGMLCSWKELGFENQVTGIVELDDIQYKNEIGNPFNMIYKNITNFTK